MKRNKFKMIKMFLSIIVIVGIISFLLQPIFSQAEERKTSHAKEQKITLLKKKEMVYQLGEGVEKVIKTRYRYSKDHPWKEMELIYQWPKWEECEDWKEYTDMFSGGPEIKIADDIPEFSLGYGYNQFDKVELGPEIYGRWNRPGLPFPWELTKEERKKLEAIDISYRQYYLYFKQIYAMSWDPCFGFIIIDRKGHVRRKLGKQYQKLHKYYAFLGHPEINFKSIFLVDEPEDVRGLGTLNITYMDEEKSDDMFLYLTTLRKVRRMSEASKQDSFLGTTHHYDDFFPKVKMYNHKIVRTEVFKSPGEHVFGYKEDFLKTCVNGIGRECWVIEWIPKKKWYFSKKLIWVDKENFIPYYEEKYDSKGKLLSTHRIAPNLPCRSPHFKGAKDIYTNCFFFGEHNVQINHRTMCAFYATEYDADYHKDDTIMSTEHLVRGYYRIR